MNADRKQLAAWQLFSAWWEASGPQALHPVQVQIIEALRWIGEPLHAIDLREVFEDVVWTVPDLHLRKLNAAGAVTLVDRPVCLHMTARYRLAVESLSGD